MNKLVVRGKLLMSKTRKKRNAIHSTYNGCTSEKRVIPEKKAKIVEGTLLKKYETRQTLPLLLYSMVSLAFRTQSPPNLKTIQKSLWQTTKFEPTNIPTMR